MASSYTKSSPKIHDFNPLTHDNFYSPPRSPEKSTYDTTIFRDANKIYTNIGPSPPPAQNTSLKTNREFKDPITGRSYAFIKPASLFASSLKT